MSKAKEIKRTQKLCLYFPGKYIGKEENKGRMPFEESIKDKKDKGFVFVKKIPLNSREENGFEREYWNDVSSVFLSCGIAEYIDMGKFKYGELYCEGGVSVVGEFENLQNIGKWLEKFYLMYRKNNPIIEIERGEEKEADNRRPIWQIFDMPIAWIKSDSAKVPKGFNPIIPGIDAGITEINGGVVIWTGRGVNGKFGKEDEIECAIVTTMLLKMYSGEVVFSMKRKLSEDQLLGNKGEKNNMKKIHTTCSLFLHIYHSPYFTETEFGMKLFKEICNRLKFSKIEQQIQNAKECLDYRNEFEIRRQSSSINFTVVLTGYLSVLLSVLGFCEIYGTDLFSFYDAPDAYKYGVLILTITVIFVAILFVLFRIRDSLEKIFENIVKGSALRFGMFFSLGVAVAFFVIFNIIHWG